MHQLMQQPGRHEEHQFDDGQEPVGHIVIGHEFIGEGHVGHQLAAPTFGQVGHIPPTAMPPGIGQD